MTASRGVLTDINNCINLLRELDGRIQKLFLIGYEETEMEAVSED